MANTWNFKCYQPRDWGYKEDRGSRCSHGGFFASGRKHFWMQFSYGRTDANLWNTVQGTIVMCFNIHDMYTASGGEVQGVFSGGRGGDARNSIEAYVVHNAAGDSKLHFEVWDRNTTTQWYTAEFGDEDGVSWLDTNKWYQFIFSYSPTAYQVMINGSLTATQNITVNAPGTLNWSNPVDSAGGEMFAFYGRDSYYGGSGPPIWMGPEFLTCTTGPLAMDDTPMDLTDSTSTDRIFNEDGNFKFAGWNGSLWFNDAYEDPQTSAPRLFLPDGSGWNILGSNPGAWLQTEGGSSGSGNMSGNLRHHYEGTNKGLNPRGYWYDAGSP